MGEYKEINDDIIIDFSVPDILRDMMDKAEAADLSGDFSLYYDLAENIDTMAKNCYAAGKLSKKQWETLCRRYC